jgi:hypothetical protein
MKTVFLLEHTFEDGDDKIKSWDTKTLGIYSTREKAELAIQFFKTLPGFKDYPDDCFCIDEYELDKNEWGEGFVADTNKLQAWQSAKI